MIYLNGKKVEFIEFPNKERRLDLPKSMINPVPENSTFKAFHIINRANIVYWKYENDASIFELLLLDDAIWKENEKRSIILKDKPNIKRQLKKRIMRCYYELKPKQKDMKQ